MICSHHCGLHLGVLLLFVLLQAVPVSSNGAGEVAVEGIKPEGQEEAPEDVLLLGLGPVACPLGAEVNVLGLVPDEEVDQVPDGNKGERDDCEVARWVEFASGRVGVSREKQHEERA